MTRLNLVAVAEDLECYTPATGNPVLSEAKLIYDEIFGRNSYLRALEPIEPTGLIVDAGANIGLFTLFVKQRFPQVSVIAIEPMPQTVAALRANIRLHGLTDVTVHAEGLADRAGTAQFYFFPAMPGNSTAYLDVKLKDRETIATYATPAVAEQVYSYEAVSVPVRPLSQILRESAARHDDIELLKIDIEGGEATALDGIADDDWPRIKRVVMEVHESEQALGSVLNKLRSKGFETHAQPPDRFARGIDNRIVLAVRA
ncbi:FkbM family methyltransferase [Saccharopolyspora hattusasensis]|uniref:FkbM family methyltransferase n=1 Tax=Saccharopolyspora hattusasensis TaxID=1128679 RepID=UPI003D97BF27